jgi:hypothetical protein
VPALVPHRGSAERTAAALLKTIHGIAVAKTASRHDFHGEDPVAVDVTIVSLVLSQERIRISCDQFHQVGLPGGSGFLEQMLEVGPRSGVSNP